MKVLKDFSTPRRRWRAGEDFDARQLDGPLTVLDLQRLNFLPAALLSPGKKSRDPETPTPGAAE
jgi:hypothetical protein